MFPIKDYFLISLTLYNIFILVCINLYHFLTIQVFLIIFLLQIFKKIIFQFIYFNLISYLLQQLFLLFKIFILINIPYLNFNYLFQNKYFISQIYIVLKINLVILSFHHTFLIFLINYLLLISFDLSFRLAYLR